MAKGLDKTALALTGISIVLLVWLFGSNPKSADIGLFGTAVVILSLSGIGLYRGIKAAREKGERLFQMKHFVFVAPLFILGGYIPYHFKQELKVSDTKLAMADMHRIGEDLKDSWGTLIRKKESADGKSTTYQSAGRDQKFETKDDIEVTFSNEVKLH